ncbi:oligosaccharide flippase family protein [Aromatoleum diolicum]|uniref:Oligosaccharide flippase family protein n=1 Tax=Aromatoleum diolicum TaxID=75796 RepID=A0ABX1QIG4_9RHOO|nr:oligosaccharide flippase family protein [Aromatoleum diolicum]
MKQPRSFARNAFANFLARGWAGLLWLALVPVYLQFLGSEAYGLVGLYLSLSMIVQLLDLGLSPTMTRELARNSGKDAELAGMRDLVATAELASWGMALTIAIGLCALFELTASTWIRAGSLSHDQISKLLSLAGLAIAAQWPVLFYSGALSGLDRQTWTAGIGASFSTLRGVGAALILWQVSATPEAFFLWSTACSLGHSLAVGIAYRCARPPALRSGRPRLATIRSVRRFAAGMSVLGMLAIIVTQADKLLLSAWLPLEQYGHYMVAATLSTIPQFIVAPVSAALLPELSRTLAHGQSARALSTYWRASRWLAVALAAPAGLALMFGEPILLAWSGNSTLASQTGVALSLLMMGSCLNGLMCIPYAWQIARGWPRVPIRINIFSLFIMLPTLWFGARSFGAAGAGFAWMAFNLSYLALNLRSMISIAPETRPVENLLRDNLRPFFASVIVCAIASTLPLPETRFLLGVWLFCVLLAAAIAAFVATPRCIADAMSWLQPHSHARHD